MSADYFVFSRLPPRDVDVVVEGIRRRLELWGERHGDHGFGDLYVGGAVPSPERVRRDLANGDLCIPPDDDWLLDPDPEDGFDDSLGVDAPKTQRILKELAAVRSAVTINRPGMWHDPLNVAVWRDLLRRLGPGVVLFLDTLDLTDTARAGFARLWASPGFETIDVHDDPPFAGPSGEAASEEAASEEEVLAILVATVERWVAEGQVELTADTTAAGLARALEGYLRGGGLATLDDPRLGLEAWLMEQEGVDELFADNQALAGSLLEGLRAVLEPA